MSWRKMPSQVSEPKDLCWQSIMEGILDKKTRLQHSSFEIPIKG